MKSSPLIVLLRPPAHADEDLQRRAKVLYFLSLSVGLGALIGLFATIFVFDEKVVTTLASVILLGIAVMVFLLARTRHVDAAAVILLSSVWILTTGIVSVSQGMHSLDIIFYVTGTAIAGLLLGRRGTYFYGGASLLVGLIFLAVENAGVKLPDLFPFPARSGWMLLVINLAMLIPAINVTLDTLTQAVADAHKLLEAQKHAEFALRESESRFRSFIDQVSDGIIFFNDQGRVIEWNLACEHLFGFTKQQALGMYIWDVQVLITPDDEKINWDIEKIKRNIQQAFGAGLLEANSQFREARFNKPDGSIGIGEQRLFPIQTEHGFAIGAVFRDLTERKLAEAKIQQRLNELVTVNAVSQVATSRLEVNDLIQITGKRLQQIPNVDCLFIALYDAPSQMISFPYYRFFEDIIPAAPLRLGQGLTSRVIESRSSLLIDKDTEHISSEKGLIRHHAPGKEHRPAKSWLGVPMQVGEQVIGVIGVQNFEREQAFSEIDVRLWETIAANVGVAVRNAQLYAGAQQEIEERKKLEEVQAAMAQEVLSLYVALSKIAGAPENVKALTKQVAEVVVNEFHVYECGVWLFENDNTRIVRKAYVGPAIIEDEDFNPMETTGLITTAIKTGETIYAPDVRNDPRYFIGDDGTLSEFVVPLLAHGEVLGAINLESPRVDDLSERTRRLIMIFAENAALAIQNAKLVSSLEQKVNELKDFQERFNFFLEHTSEGLYRIDYDPPIPLDLPYEEQYKLSRQRGRFGECNLAIAKMYGYSSREEMLAAPYYAENEGYEASMRANIEFYRRGYRSDDQETEEYISTGEKVYFLNNAVGILRDGHFVSIWGTQRDITPLKKALAALEKLNQELEHRVEERTAELQAVNKELEAFSYSVSHDLRAPLRAIRGFSQILIQDFADPLDPMGRNFLDKVINAVTEMSDKIDGLLRFSRLSRSELKWQSLDLSALALETLETLRAGQPERAVTWDVAPQIAARGDLVLIRNVLENLLGNAWKYSSKNPQAHIEFGMEARDGKPVYFVCDNGAGFNMEYANKLFGTFQRLHRADEFEGHGIGLATVQRIIHRHGGRIWAEAEEGKGATFYFTLGKPA